MGERGGLGPGALGGPGEALGRGLGGLGVGGGWLDPCSLLALLIPIGSILYILYMDCLWTAYGLPMGSLYVLMFPQTVLATVGVLADLVEGRWSGVTAAPPGLALKT